MKMKVSLGYASKTWGLYAVLVLLSVMFVSGIGSGVLQIIMNAALLLVFMLLIFNDAAYNGEKACTLQANIDKQIKEGRTVDEHMRAHAFSRKTGLTTFAICLVPFLVLSLINLAMGPSYQDLSAPAVIEEEEEQAAFSYDPDAVSQAEPVSKLTVVTRLVYMPFVASYAYVTNGVLNILFVLYAFVAPGIALAGYMMGPMLRKKKLHDIALGKKRKARNLKVNNKRGPRAPKAEV